MAHDPHGTWQNFRSGLACYLRVPAALTRHRLWAYQLLPALLSLVITLAAIAAMIWLAGHARAWFDQRWGEPSGGWRAWVSLTVGVGAFLAMAVAFLFLHKRIVLVALAPFLARISETITRNECGPQPGPPMSKWQALRRSASINTRSLAIELGLTLPLLVVGLVLFISPVTSVVILFISARYAGNGLMDFPLEYRGLSVKESIAWSRRHKATAIGIGLGYQLFLMVPFLGWMFAPTFATVAGTLRSIEKSREASESSQPDKPTGISPKTHQQPNRNYGEGGCECDVDAAGVVLIDRAGAAGLEDDRPERP
jgi:CysZ protein